MIDIKNRLKQLASSIKESKSKKEYAGVYSHKARHLHMLYGVIRGVPMGKIEAKCRVPLDLYTLSSLAERYDMEVDCEKIVCYSRSVLIS